jgi:hypothetical protein
MNTNHIGKHQSIHRQGHNITFVQPVTSRQSSKAGSPVGGAIYNACMHRGAESGINKQL